MPPQDVGVASGAIEGAEDASPAERRRNAREVSRIILSDPAVTSVAAAITSWGDDWLDINLKPFEERKATASEVIERLRPQLGTLLRFRPIVMTTLTAPLASLPLALSTGPGAALRQ